MSLIRPLDRSDLPQVAALYELVVRSGHASPAPGLATYFESVLLDQPWADPEIPSLVHLDGDGRIVAFQGSSVRRARFNGRPIRIACAGQLAAHPDARHRAVGAALVRAYLDGPQDLTITDTANDRMRRIWTLLGGEMVHLGCIGWLRVLQPWQFTTWYARHHPGGRLASRRRPLQLLDRATTRWWRPLAPPAKPTTTSETLTPAGVVEHLDHVGARLRLHLDYDEGYVSWLFAQLTLVGGLGTPVRRLVREPDGRVIGWYVYYLQQDAVSQVLQVAAVDRHVGPTLDDLLHHAWRHGAIGVMGRLEPRLQTALAERRCRLYPTRYTSLSHSRDKDISAVLASEQSLLTRLDGEWWIQDREVELTGLG